MFCVCCVHVKERQEKDKIGSKPDKKGSVAKLGKVKTNHSQERKKNEENTSSRDQKIQILKVVYIKDQRNSYVYDPNPNSFDFPPDSYHPPHPTYETYSYDSYGNDSQLGYDCQPQFPLNYESEPGYIENYNSYPYDSPSLPQQYPCCTCCGGPHETCQCDQLIFDEPYCKHCGGPHIYFQCQPMNPDSYNSNSFGFDQPQPHSSTSTRIDVENLIPIPSESEGIPDHMCDVPFHDNYPHLDVSKAQFEDFSESNDEFSSTDDDYFSIDNIDYVEASPPDSELVSSEVMEIVIPKVGGIDDDILLRIQDDILRENLLNVNHLFAKIEASNDNPTPFYDPLISGTPPTLTPSGENEPTSSQFPKSYLDPEGDILLLEAFLNDDHSSDFKTKSSSTFLNSLLEETNNFDNSLPEFTTFSNVLFDAEYESNSSDDQSCSDEDVLEKIVSKPLFEEEIIPLKIDPHPDNAESDLMKSL
nr:hypothetical protein [Tanacetum cinerariifolium]